MLGTSRVIVDQGDAGAPRTKPVIGLSGGIGAGKSAVAAIIRELGGGVIDSDRMAHEEMEIPEVRETFRSWWGDRVVGTDGRIDRKAVADLLFEDPSERSRMERFLDPRLERRRRGLMESCDDDTGVKVGGFDSPVL